MSRALNTIISILAILTLPATVNLWAAATDVFPMNPGSRWIYTDDSGGGENLTVNRTLTVSGISFSEMITGTKRPFYFLNTRDTIYRFDVLPGNPLETDPAVPTLLLKFPIRVGDTWISPWGDNPMSFTVLQKQKLTVPAGSFSETYKVGYRPVSDPIYQGYYWLAPGVGMLAIQSNGHRIELASFSITEFLPPEPEERDLIDLAKILGINSIISPKSGIGDEGDSSGWYRKVSSYVPGIATSFVIMALFFGVAVWMLGTSRKIELKDRMDVTEGEMVLATAMVHEGLYGEASDILRRLIGKNPQWPDLVAMFGKTLLRLGNVEEAVLELKRSLTLNPRMVDARLDLARAYIELDDSSKAFEELETILTENPEFADALCLKGDILSALGKAVQAAESYRHALKVNPSFSEAQNNLERLLAKEKTSTDKNQAS